MTIYKNITPFNRWIGRGGNKVEWIVLHYTANTWQPDLARNECAAFKDNYVGASAHFFVDDSEIWQSVEIKDTAWHCGDRQPSLNGCSNMSSIGIEMCVVYKDGVYSISDATVNLTAELVWYLLEMFPNAKLCRHYDVTGKICPQPWVTDPTLWENFKTKIYEEKPMTPAERKEFDALKATVASQAKTIAAQEKQIVTLQADVKSNTNYINLHSKDLQSLDAHVAPRYHTVSDLPSWAKPTVKKLVDRGDLKGTSEDDLGLNLDTTRVLVITDRAGGFDK